MTAAAVLLDVRLLHIRSELGYTDRIDHALQDEPEAVTAAEQRYLTRQVERARLSRERRAWDAGRAQIEQAIAALASVGFQQGVDSELRTLRRTLGRIDARLAR